MKRASITELARLANVSVTTASRALNNHPYVKKEVYERVLNAAHQLNYLPRKTVDKKRIGIIINNLEDTAFSAYRSNMLFQLSRHCGLNDIGMEIISTKDLYLLEEHFLKAAIIFQPSALGVCSTQKMHTQVISVNAFHKKFAGVSSDDRQGIGLAIDHLRARGHRKIALILPFASETHSIGQRSQAFLDKMLPERPHAEDLIAYLEHSPVETVTKLIRNHAPDAVIIGGEDMLLPVNYALSLTGTQVPRDLSVISYENIMTSEYMDPPHTTIAQDFDRLAREAIALATAVIEGEKVPASTNLLIPNFLIERESVKDISHK
jgi:LacI family transcriptional regulator